MIVVSDTSPIHYLVLTGTVDILDPLFGEVVIPLAVLREIRHVHAPEAVRHWAGALPEWVTVRSPAVIDPRIELGHGEAEAISLAMEMQATLLLIDDRRARREAEGRGLSVAGTINVLGAAAKRRLIDPRSTIEKLRGTNFHIADRIIQRMLDDDADHGSNPA